jgi:hypothetical protein
MNLDLISYAWVHDIANVQPLEWSTCYRPALFANILGSVFVTPITQKINYGIGLVSYLSRKLQIYLIFFCKDCKLILNLVNRFSFECLVFLKLLGLVFVCHFIFIQTLLKVFNVLKMHQYLFTPLFLCRTKFTDLTTLRPLKLQNVMHWHCFQRGSDNVCTSITPYQRMFCPWIPAPVHKTSYSLAEIVRFWLPWLDQVLWVMTEWEMTGTLSPVGLYVCVYWAQPMYSVLCIYVLLRWFQKFPKTFFHVWCVLIWSW